MRSWRCVRRSFFPPSYFHSTHININPYASFTLIVFYVNLIQILSINYCTAHWDRTGPASFCAKLSTYKYAESFHSNVVNTHFRRSETIQILPQMAVYPSVNIDRVNHANKISARQKAPIRRSIGPQCSRNWMAHCASVRSFRSAFPLTVGSTLNRRTCHRRGLGVFSSLIRAVVCLRSTDVFRINRATVIYLLPRLSPARYFHGIRN